MAKLKIKEVLKENGMTQVDLAERLDMHPVSLNYIINGSNQQIETLEKIAKAIGVDFLDLFEDERKKESSQIICPNCNHPIKVKVE